MFKPTFPSGMAKKDRNKRKKENTRSFVREGRRARVAPEANRLDVRLHKRELKKKGRNKRGPDVAQIYFRMESDISPVLSLSLPLRHDSLRREKREGRGERSLAFMPIWLH